jgi:HPr kinase/phosphorylase
VTPEAGQPVHASCVLCNGYGLLIVGPSGSGKSGLALRLMALGAELIADDRVVLTRKDDCVEASCPGTILGRIEARQIGILTTNPAEAATIQYVVDLGKPPASRLPHKATTSLEGIDIPLIAGQNVPNLAEALLVLTKGGFAPD